MKKFTLLFLLWLFSLFIVGCDSKTNVENTFSPEQCLEMGGRTVNTVWGFTCEEDEENLWEVVGFISPNICCK